jgi:hypothetical protein
MDRQQALNFSTDLLRISSWIYLGQDKLVEGFVKLCEEKYLIPEKYKYLYEMTKKWKDNRYLGADAASTLSRLII